VRAFVCVCARVWCARACARAFVCLCIDTSGNFKFTCSGMHLSLAKQDEFNKVII
jgi:hypothetical protein